MSRTIRPTAKARSALANSASLIRNGAPAARPQSSSPIPSDSSRPSPRHSPSAASGASTKFAISDSATSRGFLSGAIIWPTVRLRPTPSVLETTKTTTARLEPLISSSVKLTLRVSPSLHPREIAPEILEALRAAEQRREVRGIDDQDVAGPVSLRRHPEQRVQLRVPGRGERMRTIRVHDLPAQHVDRLRVPGGHLVMRQ